MTDKVKMHTIDGVRFSEAFLKDAIRIHMENRKIYGWNDEPENEPNIKFCGLEFMPGQISDLLQALCVVMLSLLMGALLFRMVFT